MVIRMVTDAIGAMNHCDINHASQFSGTRMAIGAIPEGKLENGNHRFSSLRGYPGSADCLSHVTDRLKGQRVKIGSCDVHGLDQVLVFWLRQNRVRKCD